MKSGYYAIADAFVEIPTMNEELGDAFEKKEPAVDVAFERHGITSRKDEALRLTNIPCIITDELGGVQFRKPCERAFVLMCERLSSKYAKAVYVGDNLNKDFIAPDILLMETVFFNNRFGKYRSYLH